ncbi:MAG TPA: acyl carrier protein [Kofleriaceae bacterium]
MSDDIRVELRSFILRNFLIGEPEDSLENSTALITTGIITSLAMLDLVSHLETTYRVTIPQDRLSAQQLDTVDKIAELITDLRRAGG